MLAENKTIEFKKEYMDAFKITLPNTNSKSSIPATEPAAAISEREKLVLSLLNKKTFIVRKDVESAAGISQPTAVVLLREMVEKGLLQRVGSGKLVKYKPGGQSR